MLRAAPRHVASHTVRSPVLVRPRAVVPAPVYTAPPDRTIAVRGHVRSGSAAALILEPNALSVVSADRLRRRRLQRFTIREILAVEEHRGAHGTELVIVAATTEIAVTDVDIAQAWTFCRELRQLILTTRR